MIKESKVEFSVIDETEASCILSNHVFNGQRPYQPTHAKFLASEMERGRFKPIAQIVLAETPDERKYLTNGQHTLNAIVMCKIPQKVTVTRLQCESYTDVCDIYTSIDTGKSRTFNDQVSAIGLADSLGFTPTQMNQVAAACKMIDSNFSHFRGARVHLDDAVRWAEAYAKYAHQFYDTTFGAPKEINNSIYRSATMSIGLISYRFSAVGFGRNKIDDFWNGVTFGEMIRKGDPRGAARTHLLVTGMRGGGVGGSYRAKVVPGQSARYIAKCLNGYLENKEMHHPQMPGVSDPIVIKGSPFAG